ncbi:MAG: sulfatase-like hydrolase/transferase [Gemmataceae bacterium]
MLLRIPLGLLAFFAVFPAAKLWAEEPPATRPRPNIVMFLVDDMGWQETSVPFHTEVTALNKRYRTPNMERLAAGGMKWTQAYACAVCSPTRISLLSGMSSARHRVTIWTLRKDKSPDSGNAEFDPPKWNVNGATTESHIDRTVQITPLPLLMKDEGYHTIHVGKAHFGAKGTPGDSPLHFGFDVNIAGHAAGGPGSYWGEKNYSAGWRSNELIWDVPGLKEYHGKNVYLTEALTREAIKAVEKAHEAKKPFYLYMSHYAVHAPWEKDDRFYQKYIDAGLKPFDASLASMVEGMDQSLGDILDTLKRLNIENDTIVLFMSDNGSPKQCPPNLPLRGHKLTPMRGHTRADDHQLARRHQTRIGEFHARHHRRLLPDHSGIVRFRSWKNEKNHPNGGRDQLCSTDERDGQSRSRTRFHLALPPQLQRPKTLQRHPQRTLETDRFPLPALVRTVQHRRGYQRKE